MAYWSLRSHVERRLEAAEHEPDRASRTSELARLDTAWTLLSLAAADPAPLGPRRVLAAALVAAVCAALLLASWGWGRDGLPRVLRGGEAGPGDGGGGGLVLDMAAPEEPEPPNAGAAGEVVRDRARLIADASLDGTVLEIAEAETEAPIASGPADERPYWLEAGVYTLRVWHPDCDQDWEQELTAVVGASHEVAPELCQDTSWLVVESNVEAAQVEVDGEVVGGSGAARHAVEPGERQVRVVSPGFADWEGIVELEGGRELKLQPRLSRANPTEPGATAEAAPPPPPPPAASGGRPGGGDRPQSDEERELAQGWHHETRQWLLARYDLDGSGQLDSVEELDEVSCEYWQGIERSYDTSRLGLSLMRAYGFDGEGWKDGRLGVAGSVRDLAFQRMRACGLRY